MIELTIFVNAAPMTRPTAKSIALPFFMMMRSISSEIGCSGFP